ncbi:MAG: hypothetical protein PHP44_00240 [Kiritimatiellae bacterium]|nr:hypothetical protein [Kiritimatiellia bacterium]
MTTSKKTWCLNAFLTLTCALTIALLCSSCERDDDDNYDHDIPDGMGTLVIDNRTFSDIYVYISGREQEKVSSDDYEFYDRDPGTYRVALEEKRGDRAWFGDADVMEGKKTVMKVYIGSRYDEYDVNWHID